MTDPRSTARQSLRDALAVVALVSDTDLDAALEALGVIRVAAGELRVVCLRTVDARKEYHAAAMASHTQPERWGAK